MGRSDLVSALTTDCHTSFCFYGHPEWYSTVQQILYITQSNEFRILDILFNTQYLHAVMHA